MNSHIFNFVHLSDPHLPETKEKTASGVLPYEKLEDTLNSINKLELKPRFVIITGDLIQKEATQGYTLVKKYIHELEKNNIPTLVTLGNHDNREKYREIFQTDEEKGPLFYVTEFDGFRIICLDSYNPGSDLGLFTGNQLQWLKKVLEENSGQPTIIAFHHPMHLSWLRLFDKEFDSTQRSQFYQIIARHNILAVLNGHLHHNVINNVNGVLHIQASSVKSELVFNEEDYRIRNTLRYNQVIIHNNAVYVNTHSLPYDGRILSEGSLQQLFNGRS